MRDAFLDWATRDFSLLGMPFHFWTGVFFILGSMVGSFLNVVIYRMPLGLSIVHPGSHCPKCQYAIPLRLNMPLISWLWLRGRCKNCATSISPRYLGVELLTALIFAATWIHWGHTEPVMAMCLFALWSLFIAATFIDFAHFIIPDEITIGGVILGVGATLLAPALHHQGDQLAALKSAGWGVAIGFGVVYGVVRLGKLLFGRLRLKFPAGTTLILHEGGLTTPDETVPFEEIFYRPGDTVIIRATRVELPDRCYCKAEVRLALAATPPTLRIGNDSFDPAVVRHLEITADEAVLPREAMGFGDVKFMATIGAWLGWQATLFSLAAASLAGAVIGLSLVAIGRREQGSKLPFGPYLAAGAVAWILGGWSWWQQTFG